MLGAAMVTKCVALYAVVGSIADAIRTTKSNMDQFSQSDEANERAAFGSHAGDHFQGINGSMNHFVGFSPNSKLFSNPPPRGVATKPPSFPIRSNPPLPSTPSVQDESYEGGNSHDQYDYQYDEFPDDVSKSHRKDSESVSYSFEKGSNQYVLMEPKEVLEKVSAIRASLSSFKATLGELEDLLIMVEDVNRHGGEDYQYAEYYEYAEESVVAKTGKKAKGQDLQDEEIIPSKKHKKRKDKQISELDKEEDVADEDVPDKKQKQKGTKSFEMDNKKEDPRLREPVIEEELDEDEEVVVKTKKQKGKELGGREDEGASVKKHKRQLKKPKGSDVEDEEKDFAGKDVVSKKGKRRRRKAFEMDEEKNIPSLRQKVNGFEVDEGSEVVEEEGDSGEQEMKLMAELQKVTEDVMREYEGALAKKPKQQMKKDEGSDLEADEEIDLKKRHRKKNPKTSDDEEDTSIDEEEAAEEEVPVKKKKQKGTGTTEVDEMEEVAKNAKNVVRKALQRATKAYKSLHKALRKSA